MSREFATSVVEQLTRAGYLAYWAGGCVRDLLLGKSPSDFDVATSATPPQVREVFGQRRTLAVGESFGVIIVLGPRGSGEQVEVATFRSEGAYSDGRRPDAVVFSSPEEDARRRDFTINGMFFDPLRQQVLDFVGGQEDLRRRIIRAIGNPRDRMSEDKLRMLRAVRFAALLDYDLDGSTALAIQDMASQVLVVSAERVAVELRKMLAHPQRAKAMRLADELRLLPIILPELDQYTLREPKKWEQRLHVLRELGTATAELALAAVLYDVPADGDRRGDDPPHTGTVLAVCRRLKLSNEQTDEICWLSRHRELPAQLEREPLATVKRFLSNAWSRGAVHLARTTAGVAGSDPAPFDWIDRFLQHTPAERLDPPELLTGRDLIHMGYQPGPEFKLWLDAVRAAQLNEKIDTKAEAEALVRELAGAGKPAAGY